MIFFKRLKAKKHKIPYSDDAFWPAFYISFDNPAPNNATVSTELYHAKIGEVVPVFIERDIIHLYKLKSIWRSLGSDHIVSPLRFSITYERSEVLKGGE